MGVKIWVNKGHVYLSLCYGGKQWRESTGLTIPKTKTLEKEVMKAAEELRCKREIEMATSKAGMMPPEERGQETGRRGPCRPAKKTSKILIFCIDNNQGLCYYNRCKGQGKPRKTRDCRRIEYDERRSG